MKHNTSSDVRGMNVALAKVKRTRKKTRDFMTITKYWFRRLRVNITVRSPGTWPMGKWVKGWK